MIPTTSRIAKDLPIILDLFVIPFYCFAKNQSNKLNILVIDYFLMIFLFKKELNIPIEKIISALKIKTIKYFWSREGKSPSIICFIVIF